MKQLMLALLVTIISGTMTKAQDTPPPGVPSTVSVALNNTGTIFDGTNTLSYYKDLGVLDPSDYTGRAGWGTGDGTNALIIWDTATWGEGTVSLKDAFQIAGSDYQSYNGGPAAFDTNNINDETGIGDLDNPSDYNLEANGYLLFESQGDWSGTVSNVTAIPESGVLAGVLPLIGLLFRPNRKEQRPASQHQHSRIQPDSTCLQCLNM